MGLIKAALGSTGGVLADQWKEYFYCDSMAANVLVTKGKKRTSSRNSNTKGSDNIISNGSVVAVNEGQCMMIVEQGKIVEFAAEAGIPEGVFNVITGPGSSVGEALGLHPGVDVVSFTGSTEVGRRFLEYAARSNLKRIVLELGGKSPFVVLDDVADYAAVAAQAAAAAFWNMGENCTANSRIIVPRKRKDAFTEALLAELENWRIGDPLDPENNLGSIVSEGQFRTIMGYIEKGKAEGGHVLTGGAPLAIGSGLFIPPTVFDGVTPDMAIVREEIFGPVTAILPADSDEEAVGLANATAYGLQATLFTEDVTKAHKYARALKAGTVSVNCFSEGDNTTPFGGYKLSGFGGKDKGRESHDQYTETKTIFLNLDR